MKILKYLLILFAFNLLSCSEDIMDDINKDLNNTSSMDAKNLLPDVILKTAYESTATDIAWYATVFVEHSAGTWAQSRDADTRTGQEASSVMNNSWNNLYNVLTICKAILAKTDPTSGDEFDNYWVRGIGQIMTAYNLAIATDMWGEIPWTEACLGTVNLKPKYENQSVIYGYIQALLDDAIVNLNQATVFYADKDYIFGTTFTTLTTNRAAWIKVANSLKARYYLRLVNRNGNAAATDALTAISGGFTSAADNFIFNRFTNALYGANPWWEFRYIRAHLSVGQTLYNLMNNRVDPRIPIYFTQVGGVYAPAPNGTALEVQAGTYSRSVYTAANTTFCMTQPIPCMTYHELKFIEAEAKYRTGDATWTASLEQAIQASFVYKGLTAVDATTYFNSAPVQAALTANALQEIITQKYIAFYESEAIEAYNDYRRTGFPTMNNPHNAVEGFVNRLQWAQSEESSNSANVPTGMSIYTTRVWWAGGNELIP